ncbi:MAG TPA: hydrolase [Streptomyces sp.]|nr:hydrolase [Streptomyces sp.]
METTGERHCWDDVIGDDERLIESCYQPRLLGRRPALLLIDCYQKVFGDRPRPLAEAIDEYPATCGTAGWDALPHLTALLEHARQVGVPVFHTTGDARLGSVTLRSRAPGRDGPAGYDFVAPLAPAEGETVIRKSRASAFFDTPLATRLRRLGIDTLLVAGETTSGCVRASAVDAYSHGFIVGVVEEATFDRSSLSHKVNLFDLHLKYASVLHVDRALNYLDGAASAEPPEDPA